MVLNRKGFFLELGDPDPAVAAKYAEANAARSKVAAKESKKPSTSSAISTAPVQTKPAKNRTGAGSSCPNQHGDQAIADDGGSHCCRARSSRGRQADRRTHQFRPRSPEARKRCATWQAPAWKQPVGLPLHGLRAVQEQIRLPNLKTLSATVVDSTAKRCPSGQQHWTD